MTLARILLSVRDPDSAIPDFAALNAGTLGLRLSNPAGPLKITHRTLSRPVCYFYAGPPGFEPGTSVLETDVLPLKL